jgi:hypothetical protein
MTCTGKGTRFATAASLGFAVLYKGEPFSRCPTDMKPPAPHEVSVVRHHGRAHTGVAPRGYLNKFELYSYLMAGKDLQIPDFGHDY